MGNSMEIKNAKDCETVEDVYACLKELNEDDSQPLNNPADLEQLERKIMEYTNRLTALLLKKKSKVN